VSHLISVQLDVLGGLLAELRALGVELTEEEQLTGASGRSLARAIAGPVGAESAAAGAEWTGALGALAARTLAVAATLEAALDAYRTADLGLAGRLAGGQGGQGDQGGGAGRVGLPAVPR
jgi:hypothetical protein